MDISNLDLSELDSELTEEEIEKFVKNIATKTPEVLPIFLAGRMVGRMDVIASLMRIVNAYVKGFEDFGKLMGKE